MSLRLTLTFEGKHELLLKAIEAYEQAELFEDDQGNPVHLNREEIALNMLMEGCLNWVEEVAGLPEDLEDEIRETFGLCEDDCAEDCECDEPHESDADHFHKN